MHGWNTGWKFTWRSYSGHSDGLTGGWYVLGKHYSAVSGALVFLGNTTAVHCNITHW